MPAIDLQTVFRVALRALARNKMRTTLTMLGIVIGVGAVITTVAVSEGASNQVQEQLRNMGENIVFIPAGSRMASGVRMGSGATKSLTVGDSKAILQQVPLIKWVSPGVNARAQVVYGNQNWFTMVRGVSPEYLQIRQWPVVEGSPFTQRDLDSASNVCLIGQIVVENLFGGENPVGKTIRVKEMPFLVIGVLGEKGQSPFGFSHDDALMVPYTTVQKKLAGIDWLNYIVCSAISREAIQPAEAQITSLLRQRHRLRPDQDDDFMVRSPTDLAETQAQTGRIMTLLLATIASIALLVGGIGIMNIMLVSVTERTREIGVRMAVGATEQDVQRQFLLEALALSTLGGLLGVILGVTGAVVVSGLLDWPTLVPPQSILIAFFFAAAVGVCFGYYPARKAARLNPIEALRYE